MREKSKSAKALLAEIKRLRQRLEEAEQVLNGIRAGEVDAVVISAPEGEKVYTLAGAEQPYRILIEAMNEGALTLLADGTILYANARFAGLVKRTLEEVIGRPLDSFVDLAYRHQLAKLVERPGAASQTAEITLLAADNTQVRTQFSVVPMGVDGLNARCVVVTDLTAVLAARQARIRLASIVESSDEAIISTNLDGIILSWNAGAERMLGFAAKEARGRSIAIINPPEFSHEMDGLERSSNGGKAAMHSETERVRKDGTRIEVSLSVSPIQDASGRVVGTSHILHDMSERKRAEQRLRDLLEAAPDPVVVANPEGKVVFVSAKIKEVFGYEPGELLGKAQDILFPERFRGDRSKAYASLVDAPQARLMEAGEDLYGLRKNGSEFPIEVSLNPLRTDEGTLAISAIRDITDRKRAEEEIRRLSSRLMRAHDEERLRISRELHDSTAQELAALVMNLSVIQSSCRLKGRSRKRLQTAVGVAKKCADEIRDISHLLHPLVLDDIGLLPALRQYVEEFNRSTGIAVDLIVPDKLDPLPKETETALYRIVQEGLTNVLRHSGSPRVNVEITTNPQRTILAIADEGRGMPSGGSGRDLRRVLKSGLGVSGMRERAKLIGAKFEVASSKQGTTLSISVPRHS